jgi:hypothetical protein
MFQFPDASCNEHTPGTHAWVYVCILPMMTGCPVDDVDASPYYVVLYCYQATHDGFRDVI